MGQLAVGLPTVSKYTPNKENRAGMAIVDFTNPDACKWYQRYLRELIHMGIDSFKTDFGERIPFKNVKYYNGADPAGMHNYYTQLYNRTVHEVLNEELGPNKGCLFARSATAGGQQFPVHWGGDCESTFEAMAETLRGGLSLGLSGFAFWAHDIGVSFSASHFVQSLTRYRVLKERRLPHSISAGANLAFSHPIHGCTALDRSECHGSMAKTRAMCSEIV
jgi:hypothetical protein